LLTDAQTNRAVAVHSVLFTAEPFSVVSPLNLSSNKRTRIMVFASNLELIPNETFSVVTAQAIDSRGIVYALPVEFGGKVPEMNWLSSVIVRLPDDPTLKGDISLTITVHGVTSNSVVLAIKAP